MPFRPDLRRWTTCAGLCLLVVACGARARNPGDDTSAGGDNSSGGAGPGGTSGGAGELSTACPLPSPPTPPVVVGGPPASFACASAKTDGTWVEVPCACELWLRNPLASPMQTTISLEYQPTMDPPALSAGPDVELRFPDPDASWYGVWINQTDSGATFTLSHENGVTSMRLGASKVSLASVTLPACARLTASSSVNGPWGTRLQLAMNAVMADSNGDVVTTSMGACEQPAMHPTFPSGEASAGGRNSDAVLVVTGIVAPVLAHAALRCSSRRTGTERFVD
jgi:hypothetical protein